MVQIIKPIILFSFFPIPLLEVIIMLKTNTNKRIIRYQLKKQLEFLSEKKGFHTELISLYIPPEKEVFEILKHLKSEVAESNNIKSKSTRKNVINCIKSLVGKIKHLKSFPENGVVMFAGAIPENLAGTEKIEFYSIIPPEPVPFFKYYCDSTFWLEPLTKMIFSKEKYGIIQVDNKEATLALLSGIRITIYKKMSSGLHSKHQAGGQSQARFQRLIEQGAKRFYQKISEQANKFFKKHHVKGIFIIGAGHSKKDFVNAGYLSPELKENIISLIDVGYAGYEGIRASLDDMSEKIDDLELIHEKKAFERFLDQLNKNDRMITYGINETFYTLKNGAVDFLLISEGLSKYYCIFSCEKCDYSYEQITDKKYTLESCPKCNSNQIIVKNDPLIDEFLKIALENGTKVQLMSTKTEWGDSLLQGFTGIAAVLRYEMRIYENNNV